MNQIFLQRKYFKILFIIYMLTNTLALGYFDIQFNPLSLIVIIYGVCIILYSLVQKELIYSKNHLLLVTLYGLLLIMATYFNKDYSTRDSYLIAFMQFLIFVLLFEQPKSMTLKTLKQELHTLIPITCLFVGVTSFISLAMYFMNISGENNGWYIGLVGSRLFGIYFNCNPASFLAIIVILLSLIAIKNHYKFEFLYFINIIIQLSYVILTQCRAALIILAIIITAVLYYHFFRSKEISTIKKVCLNISICLCIIFGSTVMNKIAFTIPQLQGAIVENESRFQLGKVKEIVVLTMSGQLQNIPKIIQLTDEISSGRITLLKNTIKIWEKNPMHGIGAHNFRPMLIDITNDQSIGQQILHSHQVFLETLVTTGIFGFIVFILFFIKTLFVTRDILIKYKNKKSYFMILLLIMIYVSEFIGGLFDFGVFYVYSLSATLAWIFLGYIYWLNDQPDITLLDNVSIATFNKYELLSIQYEKEDLDVIKPEFIILSHDYQDDYILKVQYFLGQSSFIYNLYYTLNQSENDQMNQNLAREFYAIIKDDIHNIYQQSHMK